MRKKILFLVLSGATSLCFSCIGLILSGRLQGTALETAAFSVPIFLGLAAVFIFGGFAEKYLGFASFITSITEEGLVMEEEESPEETINPNPARIS